MPIWNGSRTRPGGRSYFLNDPQGLEQILLKDVKDFSGSTTDRETIDADRCT